jgi:hypothetical protein
MNNNYIVTLGTAFANDHATNKHYVDNLSYTQSINGLLSKFMDMPGLLFKISNITVTATETVIPTTQDTSIVNNPNQNVITLNTNLFTPSSNGSNYTLNLVMNLNTTVATPVVVSVYNNTTNSTITSATQTFAVGEFNWAPYMNFFGNSAHTYAIRISSTTSCVVNSGVGLIGVENHVISYSANGNDTEYPLPGLTFLEKLVYKRYHQGNLPAQGFTETLIESATNLIKYDGSIVRGLDNQMHDLHLAGLNGTYPTTHVSPIFFTRGFNQTGSIRI